MPTETTETFSALELLKSGFQRFNSYRKENPDWIPDLRGADLTGMDLCGADLSGANLGRAKLTDENLIGADLSGANLSGADLSGANLSGVDMSKANLNWTNLHGANLIKAELHNVKDFAYAHIVNANFGEAVGLTAAQKDLICSIFKVGS
ncbi:hypothetical protein COB55_04985 [Candidatus Wolfebacteria bacterium]|nr:MAG: hypothetical protein COB55_04985 [Candidatus Wolfebacteria bacterium]